MTMQSETWQCFYITAEQCKEQQEPFISTGKQYPTCQAGEIGKLSFDRYTDDFYFNTVKT